MPTYVATEPHELRVAAPEGGTEIRYFARGVEVDADTRPGKFWIEGTRADLPFDSRFDGLPPPTRHEFPGLIERRPDLEPAYVRALRESASK